MREEMEDEHPDELCELECADAGEDRPPPPGPSIKVRHILDTFGESGAGSDVSLIERDRGAIRDALLPSCG